VLYPYRNHARARVAVSEPVDFFYEARDGLRRVREVRGAYWEYFLSDERRWVRYRDVGLTQMQAKCRECKLSDARDNPALCHNIPPPSQGVRESWFTRFLGWFLHKKG
jgi:hypothetical protein